MPNLTSVTHQFSFDLELSISSAVGHKLIPRHQVTAATTMAAMPMQQPTAGHQSLQFSSLEQAEKEEESSELLSSLGENSPTSSQFQIKEEEFAEESEDPDFMPFLMVSQTKADKTTAMREEDEKDGDNYFDELLGAEAPAVKNNIPAAALEESESESDDDGDLAAGLSESTAMVKRLAQGHLAMHHDYLQDLNSTLATASSQLEDAFPPPTTAKTGLAVARANVKCEPLPVNEPMTNSVILEEEVQYDCKYSITTPGQDGLLNRATTSEFSLEQISVDQRIGNTSDV